MSTDEDSALSRRRALFGAGAAAAALGAGLAGVGPASAAADGPTAADPDGTDGTDLPSAGINGSPVSSSLASGPANGFTYRMLSMFDFSVEAATAQRAWGSYGVYASNAASMLWASLEVPPGALVRDIEWYVHNSGSSVLALGRLWVAGSGYLTAQVLDITIPTTSGIAAFRGVVPSARYGPYPLGTKLNVGIYTQPTGDVQINGCRVGFSQGVGATGLLSQPVRVYDSRTSGGKFAAGQTRTVTLPSSIIRPGVTGVVAVVRAFQAEGDGYLKVYRATSAPPPVSALNYWPGPTIANQTTIGVSTARQIKILATRRTHVIVDVLATVS